MCAVCVPNNKGSAKNISQVFFSRFWLTKNANKSAQTSNSISEMELLWL